MASGLVGKFLVAMPGIGDPRFEKAVIFMVQHSAKNAIGLIVNKPKEDITIADVLDHMGITAQPRFAPLPVLDGGPVGRDRGFVLHSQDFAVADTTQPVTTNISLTTTRDVLEAMGGPAAPARAVLALGFSSWDAGQLEDELRSTAWLVVDGDDQIVFDAANASKWERAIRILGIDPAHLAGEGGTA